MKTKFFPSLLCLIPFYSYADIGNMSYSFIHEKEITAEIKIKQFEEQDNSAYLSILCNNYKNDYTISIHNLEDKDFSSTSYETISIFKHESMNSIWKSGYIKNKNFIYKIGSNKDFLYQLKKSGQVLIKFENSSKVVFFNASDKKFLAVLLDNMAEHCSLLKI